MRVTTSPDVIQIKDIELLKSLLDYACISGKSLAAWSLPEETALHVIVSNTVLSLDREATIEDLPPGYLFAPFDRDKQPLFLSADFRFSFENGKLQPPKDNLDIRSHEWLNQIVAKNSSGTRAPNYHIGKASKDLDRDHFVKLAEKALKEVEAGTFEKVVPSRSKTVQLDEHFDLVTAFLRLCKTYSHGFVSLTSSPDSGTWIGASPEELVRVFDKTIFKTVALAGTQAYREGENLRNVSWTQKEIEEQALVERYIISCFKKIRLREYDEHGPKTVVAGNLMHLRSEFTVNLNETNFPLLGSVMLRLLHPTAAVCGMPLESSLSFLRDNEGYDRGFYAGYLGPVNLNNQINLFVNLRCMQALPGQAVCYAGAGVTIDSIPQDEWDETEMKMNTLLSVIQ